MSDATPHKIAKWPFLAGDVLLVCMASFLAYGSGNSTGAQTGLAVLCLVAGACFGVVPFILEYRVTARLAEAAALSTVMSQIKGIESVAEQIKSATANWQGVQEHSDKAAAAARGIAERMTAEVQAFGEFMQKVNDNEKANLRLEVEKLRRIESEWLQVLVRTLDHVYALNRAALRSGKPGLIEQLSHFQDACRDAARRVGLTPFLAMPGDAFDTSRHQLMEGAPAAAPDGKVEETVATGYTFQGRLLRPALVRLQQAGGGQQSPAKVEPGQQTGAALEEAGTAPTPAAASVQPEEKEPQAEKPPAPQGQFSL